MSEKPDDSYLYQEEVEISDDSGDEGKYGNVSDGESSSDGEDLAAMLTTMKAGGTSASPKVQSKGEKQPEVKASVEQRHTVVDDFIRNFFSKLGMQQSLDAFETEWYQMKQQGKFGEEDIGRVPDIYARNKEMDEQVKTLRKELEAVKLIANKAKASFDKFKKQRDYHKMHHRRVAQEKSKLVTDIKRLKRQISNFEPALAMMRKKYEQAINRAMMISLAKERTEAKIVGLTQQLQSMEKADTKGARRGDRKGKTVRKKGSDSVIPSDDRPNPNLNKSFEPTEAHTFKLQKNFQGAQCGHQRTGATPQKACASHCV